MEIRNATAVCGRSGRGLSRLFQRGRLVGIEGCGVGVHRWCAREPAGGASRERADVRPCFACPVPLFLSCHRCSSYRTIPRRDTSGAASVLRGHRLL